ncbi:adenylate kinase 1 isoform X2 [Lycorma delicatula]|uniref:adenylate kinase 1 isoform X2 n=1 Tax=Lycorma delicatula TaxID=130591 RepID=UPI003F516500
MATLDFKIPDTSALKQAKIPIIWILGGPGSGKGTICDKLVAKYGFTHISSGDLLRADVESGSVRGAALKVIMTKGELVPMEVVLGLIAEKMLSELKTSKGFLIDGYPRQAQQGVEFEKHIKPCDLVIYLDAKDDVMIARLLNRGKTSGRADDNEETIKKRLQTFHDHNDPIVKNYSAKMLTIDAQKTPEQCFNEAAVSIDKLLK